MKNMDITFSIIVPVYNSGGRILKTLNSILYQDYERWELIIVNDGSTDNTDLILQRIISEKQDTRIKMITQKNKGAGAARNCGIVNSIGEYLVFIDSDDYVNLNYLSKIYYTIKSSSADVVFVDLLREDREGIVIRRESMSSFERLGKERMIRWQLTGKMPWGGVRKIVRSSIIQQNSLRYAESIRVGEESIFSFSILKYANVISFAPGAIYHYVDNDESLTFTDNYSNSLSVFDYIYQSLSESGDISYYKTTIAALAVTTVAIQINLLASKNSLIGLFKGPVTESINSLKLRFGKIINGSIDYDCLDWRVKWCIPLICLELYRMLVCFVRIKILLQKCI